MESVASRFGAIPALRSVGAKIEVITPPPCAPHPAYTGLAVPVKLSESSVPSVIPSIYGSAALVGINSPAPSPVSVADLSPSSVVPSSPYSAANCFGAALPDPKPVSVPDAVPKSRLRRL
jgi:hypothetical protein